MIITLTRYISVAGFPVTNTEGCYHHNYRKVASKYKQCQRWSTQLKQKCVYVSLIFHQSQYKFVLYLLRCVSRWISGRVCQIFVRRNSCALNFYFPCISIWTKCKSTTGHEWSKISYTNWPVIVFFESDEKIKVMSIFFLNLVKNRTSFLYCEQNQCSPNGARPCIPHLLVFHVYQVLSYSHNVNELLSTIIYFWISQYISSVKSIGTQLHLKSWVNWECFNTFGASLNCSQIDLFTLTKVKSETRLMQYFWTSHDVTHQHVM